MLNLKVRCHRCHWEGWEYLLVSAYDSLDDSVEKIVVCPVCFSYDVEYEESI